MGDLVSSDQLGDKIILIVVKIIDKPLSIHASCLRVEACCLDKLCIVVNANTVGYGNTSSDSIDVI
jgi:hypothetical protein